MKKDEKRGVAGREAMNRRGDAARAKISAVLERAGTAGITAKELSAATGIRLGTVRWHIREHSWIASVADTRDAHLVRYWAPDHSEIAARYLAESDGRHIPTYYLSEQTAKAFLASCTGKTVAEIGKEIGIAHSTAGRAATALVQQGLIQTVMRPATVIGRTTGGVVALCYLAGAEIPGYTKPPPKPRIRVRKPTKTAPKPKAPKVEKPIPKTGYRPVEIKTKDTRPIDASRARITVIPTPPSRFAGAPEPLFSSLRPGTYLPSETWTSRVYG